MTALAIGVCMSVVRLRRVPGWVLTSLVALVAVAAGVVPVGVARDAFDALREPLAFLLVAVPLAVLLDEVGFFAALAALVDGGRHLRLGLWALACGVTVLFNLDAAVVLLTPLYVRVAQRHGHDPVELACIPALMASLASSLLPVSNLTNLIVARRLQLRTSEFVLHLAPLSVAAVLVGWIVYARVGSRHEPMPAAKETADRRALLVGGAVTVWLLVGFLAGRAAGVPEWLVAALALAALALARRHVPLRHVPLQPALLALSLGVLALGAAGAIDLPRLFAVRGAPGRLAVFAAAAGGANVVNNLPATVLSLPALAAHPDKCWALLAGVNLGPLLWTGGALSTLLWLATMQRLGHPVPARRYVSLGSRVAVPVFAVCALLLAAH